MKNVIKTLLVLVIFFNLTGCDREEFLTPEYKNSVVDINFLTKPVHAEQAVVAIYDVLNFQGLYSFGSLITGSSSADDLVEEHNDPLWNDLINIDKYRWNPDNKHLAQTWAHCFAGVNRANQVIVKVPKIAGLDQSLSERYVAEAKALRALFYYELVVRWGDVPLFLEPPTLETTSNVTRTPAADIWAQIIKDLLEARDVLADTYPASEVGRVTKGFCNAMLSRVYLWTKEFDKAAAAALLVINSPADYQLEPRYADLFNGVAQNSKETILGVMCIDGAPTNDMWSTQYNEGNLNYLWGPYFSWSYFIQPARDFVDYEYTTGDTRVDDVTLDTKAPKSERYDLDNNGSDDDIIPDSPPGLIHLMKWVPANVDLTSGTIWSGGLDWVHINFLRLSEVYLNYFEATVELGTPDLGRPYINLLRARGGSPNVTETDKTQLLNIILNERKVEFCFEGMRFFDLKRPGKLEQFLGPLGWTSKNVVFPIPQTEIDLTNMSQNDGY